MNIIHWCLVAAFRFMSRVYRLFTKLFKCILGQHIDSSPQVTNHQLVDECDKKGPVVITLIARINI